MPRYLAYSLGLLFPRGQSVSGHMVHAKMCLGNVRHRNELTERDWQNAVQGLGNPVTQARSLPNLTEAVKRMATVRIFENLVVLRRLLTLSFELITSLRPG